MRIAVTVGVYNEEKNIARLIKSLLEQTRQPDEIIICDDGSTDKTAEKIKSFAEKYPQIKYLYQKNAGPAKARNNAWRNSTAEICVFTDGDCIPELNWIQELTKPLADGKIGATAGGYKTLNNHSLLARFIGYEIEWRYRNIKGEIDAHGTYNLAVKKSILEEIGGLNEEYPKASGEDWDMTYKISKKYKLIFFPTAIVGHYHPEKFWWYMKNQTRRAYDRIKVYKDHPEMRFHDNYTPSITKYQITASGFILPSLILAYPLFRYSYTVPLALFLFLFISTLPVFPYLAKKSLAVAFFSIPIQFSRNFAWFIGLIKGLMNFGL
ncbi:MAG: hypothetical protein COS25_02540 [Candidatus Nealsonbacteria bacterium CG02_land_8_20_14_3_00_37_10]|nr:MAG: hypothetical protein COS25_02540 [Candidatus Nealsonbacteria bacterium CG02_land_8_20_14_3_00_37_10]